MMLRRACAASSCVATEALISKMARCDAAQPTSRTHTHTLSHITLTFLPPFPTFRLISVIPWAKEVYLYGKHAIAAIRKQVTIVRSFGKAIGLAKDRYAFVTGPRHAIAGSSPPDWPQTTT